MEKYGFVYIWRDKGKNRYYIGSHWGHEDDGYVCSSQWMQKAKYKRPDDFKRKTISKVYTNRLDLLKEEQRWLNMIKDHELAHFNTTLKKRETVKYYNLRKTPQETWHYDSEKRKSVGQKVSAAKKGKKIGPQPHKGPAISAAKKGKNLTEEHKMALRGSRGPQHTEEWKAENSRRLKEQWDNGTRKRAEPKQTMSLEEQGALSSSRLKQLWADPVWVEKQRKRLAEGAKSRPPRTEESKLKARMAQLGKSKPRRIHNDS